mgnify:FL=1
MIIAVGAAIAKVATKILTVLLGDKNGRKFLGYAVGIALFLVLLPFIAVYGLFGWMAGGGADDILKEQMVIENLPAEYREMIQAYDSELNQISLVFTANGLGSDDISKAKTIFISCLRGRENEEDFYQRYADCFLNQSEEADLYTNLSSAFGVSFSDADKEQLSQIYGGV